MKKNQILGYLFALMAVFAVVLVACKEDNNIITPTRLPGYLYFFPTEKYDWGNGNQVTRSSVEAPMRMECSLKGEPIYLHTEVTPTMSPQLEESVSLMEATTEGEGMGQETRGIRYTGDVFSLSSGSTPKISSFGVYATRTSDHGVILNYAEIGPSTTESTSLYDWNVKEQEISGVWDSGTANFYGYAPYFDNPEATNGLSMTANSSGVPILTYTVPTAVANQLDILTAKHLNVSKGNDVELEFSHIMSAIKFNFKHGKGTADGGSTWTEKDNFKWSDGVNTYNVTVKTIEIKNVYTTGTWVVGGDPYNGDRWTRTADTKASFTYSGVDKGLTGESSPVDLNPDADGHVFMMLPQQVPSDATIALTCNLTKEGDSDPSKSMTLEAALKETDGTTAKTWLPGYTYTYTISLSDFVYVFDFDTSKDWNDETGTANATIKDPLSYTNISYGGKDSYPLMVRSYKVDSKGNKSPVDWTIIHEIEEIQGSVESGTPTTTVSIVENKLPEWMKLYETPNDTRTTEVVNVATEAGTNVKQVTTAKHAGATDDSNDRKFRLQISSIDEPVIDLSLYNYDQTKRWSARNTSNCYIVAGPGTYRIPLVYGNAIYNGTDNKKAYWTKEAQENPLISQSGGDAINYLYKLENHSGAPISSPYIVEVVGNSKEVKNYGEGALVWEEVNGLIQDVSIDFSYDEDEDGYNSDQDQGYLQFTIKPNVFNYGNAVIGVRRKESYDYYWSWHIWITDPTDFLDTKNIDIQDYHTVDFAGCNVGWVPKQSEQPAKRRNDRVLLRQDETLDELEINVDQLICNAFTPYLTNTLYQWGRKDPMKGITSNSQDGTDNGTPRYNESPGYDNQTGNKASIATMIQKPNTIYGVARGDLYETSYTNLWGTNCNKKKLTYTYYGKTVYDPCPVGFCVPPSKSFSKLNKRYRTARGGLFPRDERSGFVEIAEWNESDGPVICQYKESAAAGGEIVEFPLYGARSHDGLTHEMTAYGFYPYGGGHGLGYYQSASPYSNDENWAMRIDVYTRQALINEADTHVGNFKPDHNTAGAVRPVRYYGETVEEAEEDEYIQEPLTFKATSSGTITWTGNVVSLNQKSLLYSKNNGALTKLAYNGTISVENGDIVQFYVNMADDQDDVDITYAGSSYSYHHHFESTATFEAYGNIMSLISDDYETLKTIYQEYTFNGLFKGCGANLTSVANLRMPATTLQKGCYYQMFYGCSSITMAPVLPAGTLEDYCYHEMFNGCSSLNYIKAMFTSDLRETIMSGFTTYQKYTQDWVNGVNASGVFVYNSSIASTDYLRIGSTHGIPSGWTPSPASPSAIRRRMLRRR